MSMYKYIYIHIRYSHQATIFDATKTMSSLPLAKGQGKAHEKRIRVAAL